MTTATTQTETAIFAAGCFWGVEETFRRTNGVIDTAVGYTGGHTDDPTYEQVCGKGTGHAEAVRVVFDPTKVTFDQLTTLFFQMHNPTTKDRQGVDIGSQYRSAIFATSDAQLEAAIAFRARLAASGEYKGAPSPIVTEIEPASTFWRAEDYHQQYLAKRGRASCRI
ncbi:MAG: peptide-methionine (S)-S-oxide reductase MsrA [Planctomycetota bacterium]